MERSEAERWVLALAGIVTQMESGSFEDHAELGGWKATAKSRTWCRNVLAQLYGVRSRGGLVKLADSLSRQGHSASARALLSPPDGEAKASYQAALVAENAEEIAEHGLLAWDVARLVTVVGWGALAGFLSEAAAFRITLPEAERVQRAYRSWHAYGAGYELGRNFFSGGQPHEPTALALRALLTDPRSPWLRLPWDVPLEIGRVADGRVGPMLGRD